MNEFSENAVVNEVGGTDKGYLLRFKPDGAYLTVYPYSDDRILFELTDITKVLHENRITEYEIETIARIIREGSGEETSVTGIAKVESEPDVMEEPEIEISISKDKMRAELHIEMKKNSLKPTVEQLMGKIKERGITYGIREDSIRKAVNLQANDLVVAEGTLPVSGENAAIVMHVDMKKQGRPEEIENGRVDFKNLNLFIVVKQGDLLAERIPHTQGTQGVDIMGEIVAAKPGKSVMLPVGKNVKIVDEHKLIAALDGQVVIVNNKLSIDPTIQVKGDVDLSTGNIEFNGSVMVKGSVQTGFSIIAEGDVEIAGSISGGTVEARNITVRNGIQGMQRGHIKAREDIHSSFAENAKLIAGRDAIITEAILHSDISAGRKIVVQGRKGLISGGSAVAGEEILVKCAGNLMDMSTKLEVGINPMLKTEYALTKKELAKAKIELDQAQKAIVVLKAVKPELLSEAKRELLLRLTKAQFPLTGKVKAFEERIMEIEESFEGLKEGKIRVSDVAYPGVRIIVGSVVKHIRSKTQHCTFYVENGEIVTGPF